MVRKAKSSARVAPQDVPRALRVRRSLHGAVAVTASCALLVSSFGCGHRHAQDQAPEPPALVGPRAQAELRDLESEWQARGPQGRAELAPRFHEFIRRYPNDPGTLRARVLCAWIEMDKGQLDGATRTLAPALAAPESANRDRARVVKAGVLSRSGKPEQALELLSPLRGKLVGDEFIELYGRERVRAALGARRWRLVVSALTEWLGETTRRPDRVHESARVALAAVPSHALVRFLEEETPGESQEGIDPQTGQPEPTRSKEKNEKIDAAEKWVQRAAVEQLTKAALRDQDPRLARQVLDVAPSWLRASEDGDRLAVLAASGAVEARIEGRTLGFVFSDRDSTTRRRSADASSGAVDALGLGRGQAETDVRFVVREGRDDLTTALAGLAGEGASVLIAGVDDASASVALTFAENKQVPVIVLVDPPDRPEKLKYGFVLGASLAEERRLLEEELKRRGSSANVLVGPGGVSCDTEPAYPGGPRFPVLAWQKDAFGGVIVLGDRACADAVGRETRAQRYSPLLALGLDAAPLTASSQAAQGRILLQADAKEPPPGGKRPSWYELLGRDAARLAKKALEALPPDTADDPELVHAHLERATAALGAAKASLESTQASGFGGSQVLPRTLRVVTENASSQKSGARQGE